jgi:hypothetical protein
VGVPPDRCFPFRLWEIFLLTVAIHPNYCFRHGWVNVFTRSGRSLKHGVDITSSFWPRPGVSYVGSRE